MKCFANYLLASSFSYMIYSYYIHPKLSSLAAFTRTIYYSLYNSALLLPTNRTPFSPSQQKTSHDVIFLLNTPRRPTSLPSLSPPPLDVVSMLHVSCSLGGAIGGAGALRPFFLKAMEPPGEEAMESWGEEGGGGAIFFLRGVVLVDAGDEVLETVDGLLLGKRGG